MAEVNPIINDTNDEHRNRAIVSFMEKYRLNDSEPQPLYNPGNQAKNTKNSAIPLNNTSGSTVGQNLNTLGKYPNSNFSSTGNLPQQQNQNAVQGGANSFMNKPMQNQQNAQNMNVMDSVYPQHNNPLYPNKSQ